jgi:two-component system, cell cycle response regulator DivK
MSDGQIREFRVPDDTRAAAADAAALAVAPRKAIAAQRCHGSGKTPLVRWSGQNEMGRTDALRALSGVGGKGEQQRFVLCDMRQNLSQKAGFSRGSPQILRSEPCDRQKPSEPFRIRCHETERCDGNCLRVFACHARITTQTLHPLPFVNPSRLTLALTDESQDAAVPRPWVRTMAKTVLIVEDNELNMKLFNDLLEARGYRVLQTRSGHEVLSLARAHRPDLILMDIQLPEISGLDVTKWLKDDPELKSIPVIAITAFAMKGDEERIRNGGCEGYLSKPISIPKFLETVQQFAGANPS